LVFRQAVEHLTNRARFRGWMSKAINAQRALIDRFPDEIQLQNDYGVTFLMMGRNDDARKVFQNVTYFNTSGMQYLHIRYSISIR